MFEHLEKYQYIIVSGMQRSGTTVAARMIQYDVEAPQCIWLGHDLSRIRPQTYSVVYHGPGISHLLHTIRTPPYINWCVIWMKRPAEEIMDSFRRVPGWKPDIPLGHYGLIADSDRETNLRALIRVKEDAWQEQKLAIPHVFEVEYSSLQDHVMWADRDTRDDFKNVRQTFMTDPLGDYENSGEMVRASEGGELEHLLKAFPKNRQAPR
jgi:hypothetical protein